MSKHCFPHLFSTRSVLRVCIVIVTLGASFPAVIEAAKPGGGTCTTMVLTYTYGAPARWVARVDPQTTKSFQLSVMFDNTKLEIATNDPGTTTGVKPKVPFAFSVPPVVNGGVVTIKCDSTNVDLGPGDADVFEIVFRPINAARPGQLASILTENFDGVVAPALPAGWTASNASGPPTLWVTSSAGNPTPPADSAPNAAFIDDPGVASDKRLDSPIIALGPGSSRVTFRQNVSLQTSFDGGVLEISIDGGAFTDIIAAGGSFVAHPYDAVMPGCCGNPLAGRQAWSGSTAGFVTTTVNLPAAAAGHNIVLRWRMGSGEQPTTGQGWRIDNISIEDIQPPFTVFANPATNDFIDAIDTVTNQTTHYSANEIAPTTRTFTDNVFPHIWDPDGSNDSGHTGGSGTWDTSTIAWDDVPSAIPFSPPFVDTPWANASHAHDIAVFGGAPGTGIVTVVGPISVGAIQFDMPGYELQGGTLVLAGSSGSAPTIDTGPNNALISSSITGNNGLTKVGTGTLALTGPNNYTGATTVNAGTLLIGGNSGTSNTPVMVNNPGCVFGGNGTVSGPVIVNTGGAVMGGNGTIASTLTLGNNLNLISGAMIKLALGPGGGHSTLSHAGAAPWNFTPNQGFTIINLGAQPGTYQDIITGLPADPGGVPSWHINNPGFNGTFTYDGTGNIDLNVTAVPPPFALLNAVSRKTHGAAGTFNIPLPPSSPFGVECRSGGAGGNHTLVLTFTNNVVSGSVSLAGTGSISGTPVFAGNTMTVNLTGVSNAQLITLTLSGVTDSFAQVLPDFAVNMRVLAGDVNGNGSVTATDISQTKSQSGTQVTNANFRADVVVSGSINGSDISLVKAFSGTSLPKPAR